MEEKYQLEELSFDNFNIKNIEQNMDLTKFVENSENFVDQTDFSNSDDNNNKNLRQKRSINYLENLYDNDFDNKSIKAKRLKSKAENNNQSKFIDFCEKSSKNSDFNNEIKVDNCLENRSGSEIVLQMCQNSVENTDLSENLLNRIDDRKLSKKTLKNQSKINKNIIISTRKRRSKSIFKNEKITEYFFNLDKIEIENSDLKTKPILKNIIKKRRGRPKKNCENFPNKNNIEQISILNENNQKSIITLQKKVRGRPKKIILSNSFPSVAQINRKIKNKIDKNNDLSIKNIDLNQSLINGEVKRSRGRPRAIINKMEDNIDYVDENKSIKIETDNEKIDGKRTRKNGKSIKNSDLIDNQSEFDDTKLMKKRIPRQTLKMLKIDKREKIDNSANINLSNNNNLSAQLQSLKELAELEEQYRKLQKEHKTTKEALRKSELLYKESAKKKGQKIESKL